VEVAVLEAVDIQVEVDSVNLEDLEVRIEQVLVN
jgi:hypothetical protein